MIKSILVHLNEKEACDVRLQLAKQLSKKFNAKVSGIHFSSATFRLQKSSTERFNDLEKVTSIDAKSVNTDSQKVDLEKHQVQQKVNTIFSDCTVPNWETFDGDSAHDLIAQCLYHDLVILSSTLNINNLLDQLNSAIVSVASESGCPVCVIPADFDKPLSFSRPIVAWNSSRAAARAITDALPFLQDADEVVVYCENVSVKDTQAQKESLKKLGKYLTTHNVSYDFVSADKADRNFGASLLHRIGDAEHDFIVMGAYDHTNVRELMLGNTTRRVVQHARVPILLSH